MFTWIAENIGTCITAALLTAAVILVIIKLIKDRKRGKRSSCGSCAGCPMSGSCREIKDLS